MRRAVALACALAGVACAGSPYRRAGDPASVMDALARFHPTAGKPANYNARPLAFLPRKPVSETRRLAGETPALPGITAA